MPDPQEWDSFGGISPRGAGKFLESLPGSFKAAIERYTSRLRLPAARQWTEARRPKYLRQDDNFLVSYPRSGSTWLRFQITGLLWRGEISHASVRSIVPDLHEASDEQLLSSPRPRIIKSHLNYTDRYPNVILLVRDGRDVAVSLYERKIARGFAYGGFSEFLSGFLSGEIGMLGSWHEHTLQWIRNLRGTSTRFLIVRYEDMKRSPVAELRQISRFIGVEPTDADLQRALRLSHFSRMRRQERKASGGNKSHYEIREGRTGGWTDVFDERDIRRFERVVAPALRACGYSLTV